MMVPGTIKVGDIVRVKSGGPWWTVESFERIKGEPQDIGDGVLVTPVRIVHTCIRSVNGGMIERTKFDDAVLETYQSARWWTR